MVERKSFSHRPCVPCSLFPFTSTFERAGKGTHAYVHKVFACLTALLCCGCLTVNLKKIFRIQKTTKAQRRKNLCLLCAFVVFPSRIGCLTPDDYKLRLEIYKVVDFISDRILHKFYGTQSLQYASGIQSSCRP